MENSLFRLHGKALTILRINKGLRAVDVAKHLEVTKGHYCNCEKGRCMLSANDTKKFLDLIGLSEEEAKRFVEIIGE